MGLKECGLKNDALLDIFYEFCQWKLHNPEILFSESDLWKLQHSHKEEIRKTFGNQEWWHTRHNGLPVKRKASPQGAVVRNFIHWIFCWINYSLKNLLTNNKTYILNSSKMYYIHNDLPKSRFQTVKKAENVLLRVPYTTSIFVPDTEKCPSPWLIYLRYET